MGTLNEEKAGCFTWSIFDLSVSQIQYWTNKTCFTNVLVPCFTVLFPSIFRKRKVQLKWGVCTCAVKYSSNTWSRSVSYVERLSRQRTSWTSWIRRRTVMGRHKTSLRQVWATCLQSNSAGEIGLVGSLKPVYAFTVGVDLLLVKTPRPPRTFLLTISIVWNHYEAMG